MKKVLIVLFALLILGVGGYFLYRYLMPKEEVAPTKEEPTPLSLEADKLATHLSKVAGADGTYWQRGFDITWGFAEEQEGEIDFEEIDKMWKSFQEDNVYQIPTVNPYANWDQDKCHDVSYEADRPGPGKIGNFKLKVGKPCEMEKYENFLAQLVERYDGDGKDDMPGLSLPIKYWEIMNEPSMQGGSTGGVGEELKFFKGTSKEYLDILKTSFEVIKIADPEAKVLHAGMAGMQQNFQDFWDPIFSAGAGDYFDIGNIHSINTDANREDMFVVEFEKYLQSFGIKDKPIFVTESQFGELAERPDNLGAFEQLIARSTVFSLVKGAGVIFFIENWLQWDELGEMMEKNVEESEKAKGVKEPGYSEEDLSSSTHKVYLNLIDKVNKFDRVETIKEDMGERLRKPGTTDRDGLSALVGQYKFVNEDRVIYVLWGHTSLPPEIKGSVELTDIYGESVTKDAEKIILTSSPIFLELK